MEHRKSSATSDKSENDRSKDSPAVDADGSTPEQAHDIRYAGIRYDTSMYVETGDEEFESSMGEEKKMSMAHFLTANELAAKALNNINFKLLMAKDVRDKLMQIEGKIDDLGVEDFAVMHTLRSYLGLRPDHAPAEITVVRIRLASGVEPCGTYHTFPSPLPIPFGKSAEYTAGEKEYHQIVLNNFDHFNDDFISIFYNILLTLDPHLNRKSMAKPRFLLIICKPYFVEQTVMSFEYLHQRALLAQAAGLKTSAPADFVVPVEIPLAFSDLNALDSALKNVLRELLEVTDPIPISSKIHDHSKISRCHYHMTKNKLTCTSYEVYAMVEQLFVFSTVWGFFKPFRFVDPCDIEKHTESSSISIQARTGTPEEFATYSGGTNRSTSERNDLIVATFDNVFRLMAVGEDWLADSTLQLRPGSVSLQASSRSDCAQNEDVSGSDSGSAGSFVTSDSPVKVDASVQVSPKRFAPKTRDFATSPIPLREFEMEGREYQGVLSNCKRISLSEEQYRRIVVIRKSFAEFSGRPFLEDDLQIYRPTHFLLAESVGVSEHEEFARQHNADMNMMMWTVLDKEGRLWVNNPGIRHGAATVVLQFQLDAMFKRSQHEMAFKATLDRFVLTYTDKYTNAKNSPKVFSPDASVSYIGKPADFPPVAVGEAKDSHGKIIVYEDVYLRHAGVKILLVLEFKDKGFREYSAEKTISDEIKRMEDEQKYDPTKRFWYNYRKSHELLPEGADNESEIDGTISHLAKLQQKRLELKRPASLRRNISLHFGTSETVKSGNMEEIPLGDDCNVAELRDRVLTFPAKLIHPEDQEFWTCPPYILPLWELREEIIRVCYDMI